MDMVVEESLDESSIVSANQVVHKGKGPLLVTNTNPGACWVQKYLHPPGVRQSGYAGIPDRNGQPSVDYEWRLFDELDINSAISVLGSATKLLVFSPPSATALRFCFAVDPSGNYAQVRALNNKNKNVTSSSFQANVESFRLSYLSDTYEQDASALNNSGMIAGCQFRPNVSTFAAQAIELQRYRGHRGYDMLLQTVREYGHANVSNDGNITETTPALHIQVVSLGVLPTSLGDVQMRSPKSELWRSTVGGFMPHRFTEPTQKYLSLGRGYSATSGPGGSITGTTFAYLAYFETYDPASDIWTITPFLGDGVSVTNYRDFSPWYDMTWGCFMYDFSQSSIAGFGNAPITHKKVIGLEAQCPFGAMNSALYRQHAILDTKALDLADTYASVCQDMLPAAANSMGFVNSVAKWAPSVLSTLSGIFGASSKNSPKREEKLDKQFTNLEDVLEKLVSSKVAKTVAKAAIPVVNKAVNHVTKKPAAVKQ